MQRTGVKNGWYVLVWALWMVFTAAGRYVFVGVWRLVASALREPQQPAVTHTCFHSGAAPHRDKQMVAVQSRVCTQENSSAAAEPSIGRIAPSWRFCSNHGKLRLQHKRYDILISGHQEARYSHQLHFESCCTVNPRATTVTTSLADCRMFYWMSND